MKKSFYLIGHQIHDMINDSNPIDDIVKATELKTCIACGASIESVNIVDIEQYIDGTEIVSMIYAEIVVHGETFKVIFDTTNQEIVKAVLTFSRGTESQAAVMKFVRERYE